MELFGDRRHLSRGRGWRLCLRLPSRRGRLWLAARVFGGPSLAMLVLAGRAAELVDSSSLRILLDSALEVKRKEEEKKAKSRQTSLPPSGWS